MTIVEVLAARARVTPDALAFEVEGDVLRYGELATAARRLGAVLAAAGQAPGSPCGLVLPTGTALLGAVFAAQWLGARPVVLNPALPPGRIAERARRLGSPLVVAQGAVAESLAAEGLRLVRPGAIRADHELDAPRPDPVAFLQLTSGTSGEPRAAMVGQAALMACLEASRQALELSDADVFSAMIPLHHDLGLVRFVFQPVFSGRPCHLVPASLARLRDWLATAARVGATITAAPDFLFRLAARTVDPGGLDLSRLRVATSGGEPVRATTIRAFEDRFGLQGVVRPGYGLAEATLGVAAVRPGEAVEVDAAGHVGCGHPLPGTQVRIVDEQGQDLQPTVAGLILVRSASLFSGYLDDEAATRETLRDGWLHTGDVGALDTTGQLFVHGRRRALIKRGGAVVAPREIEEVVDRLAGVRLSAAVGARLADDEDVVVVVETPTALSAEEAAALERTIAVAVTRAVGFAPGRVLLVPPRTIPRTANGKLRHAELARAVERGDLGR